MKLVHKFIIILLAIAVLLVSGVVLVTAGGYYLTPLAERPYSPLHRLWRPGGLMGHGLGIVGSFMIIIMLGYSLRKRVRRFRRWGHISIWLNYHIFFGIAGPILIIFHTSLKYNGIVAVSFWSMIAVAVSGFLGRFLYVQIPRSRTGVELSKKEIEVRNSALRETLKKDYHLNEEEVKQLEKMGQAVDRQPGFLRVILLFPFKNLSLSLKIRRQTRKIMAKKQIERKYLRELSKLMRRKAIFSRRIYLLNQMHRVFHFWHVVHKPFAYVMISIMILHVAVTTYMGLTWIF